MAQQDLLHSDLILIQGSSMAEAHPVGFRFVVMARERGATVIHVDPRYSRTSALADLWTPIRAGSDLVFLGALIRHVIESGRFFRDYVVHYTNAARLVREDFRDTEDLDGLFSGWDPEARRYSTESWAYDGEAHDPTLEHPRSVFQVLRRHFARYTPEMVERSCGIRCAIFERIAELFLANSGPERTAAICYAVGWTQHTKGVQVIRAAAILQLLLGNIGRPGGGIMALRGHASIQGSTDIPTLYNMLPGYLPMPRPEDRTRTDYRARYGAASGQWAHLDDYLVSYLRATYGNAATAANDYGYGFLPRIVRDHCHLSFFTEMADGDVEGLFVMGQNPGVAGQHAGLERRALARLKWLVVRELVETETATFWRDSPEVARGELAPESIDTEVFLFPAAGHAEKDGTFTNTQRLLQWRHKAADPPGDAKSETWFVVHLGRRLKAMAERSSDLERDGPLRALTWDYRLDRQGEPDSAQVLGEINGHDVASGNLLPGFSALKSDGSTSAGCWIYSGVMPEAGRNRAAERRARGPYGHGWGFTWPADRHILYNRASARPDGAPWSEQKRLVWWDPAARRWTGHDVPDGAIDLPPEHVAVKGQDGLAALAGSAPFIMKPDGVAWLFAPSGLADGPLPTHYEPIESVVPNPLYACGTNPAANRFARPDNPLAPPLDPRFPYVLTTYRLTEHHTAGGMSRTLSRLAELQPALFVELSPELAAELAIAPGDWVTVVTVRAAIEARALVTPRIRPLMLDGRRVHQVAMPFHWGGTGLVTGDVTNDLVPLLGEPNVTIHEGKALVCAIWPGRRPAPALLSDLLARLQRGETVSPPPATGNAP
jgi:formate dehydrogenase major subunit